MLAAVIPTMTRAGTGHLVGIASVAGYRGLAGAEAYGATKAAQLNLLEGLRAALTRHGVRVTTVAPGFVRTPMTESNEFPMPFIIDADEAARTIADGLERGRTEIVFPLPDGPDHEGRPAAAGAGLVRHHDPRGEPRRAMTSILWLRRDLRLADHPALQAAADDGPVLPLFVRDPRLAGAGDARRSRLEASLAAFDEATDGALVVRSGDPVEVVASIAAEVDARSVHVTGEFTPYARRRDRSVARRLAESRIPMVATGTPYVVRPGTLLTGAGTPYQVFTPYSRAWREHAGAPPQPSPTHLRWRRTLESERLDADLVERGRSFGPVGEEAARRRWREFLDGGGLAEYAEGRDRPDLDATSRLSVHLKLGEIHPRTLLADVARHPDARSEGAGRFLTELAWREFYADVLWHRPDSAWGDLRDSLAAMAHDNGREVDELVDAWREGRTGFPFVDAGMRQLRETGWMHNRVRMVTASFLVKDLHVRWQVGARHFLDHLVDGDLASNNHGWQWVAGTGTDASPYFRVFNPVSQGKRFDPAGDYVRRWVPELAHLPGVRAHEPWQYDDGLAAGYPERVVDHAEERQDALGRYEQARGVR